MQSKLKTIIKTVEAEKPLIVTFSDGEMDRTIECSMRDLATLQIFRQLVGDKLGIFFGVPWLSPCARSREDWEDEVAHAFFRGKETKP